MIFKHPLSITFSKPTQNDPLSSKIEHTVIKDKKFCFYRSSNNFNESWKAFKSKNSDFQKGEAGCLPLFRSNKEFQLFFLKINIYLLPC